MRTDVNDTLLFIRDDDEIMEIEIQESKLLHVGNRVIVTAEDPCSRKPNFGKRVFPRKPYPCKGWSGILKEEFRGTSQDDKQWVILWDKKTMLRPDYSLGDLVYEWQIDLQEWDAEENEY